MLAVDLNELALGVVSVPFAVAGAGGFYKEIAKQASAASDYPRIAAEAAFSLAAAQVTWEAFFLAALAVAGVAGYPAEIFGAAPGEVEVDYTIPFQLVNSLRGFLPLRISLALALAPWFQANAAPLARPLLFGPSSSAAVRSNQKQPEAIRSNQKQSRLRGPSSSAPPPPSQRSYGVEASTKPATPWAPDVSGPWTPPQPMAAPDAPPPMPGQPVPPMPGQPAPPMAGQPAPPTPGQPRVATQQPGVATPQPGVAPPQPGVSGWIALDGSAATVPAPGGAPLLPPPGAPPAAPTGVPTIRAPETSPADPLAAKAAWLALLKQERHLPTSPPSMAFAELRLLSQSRSATSPHRPTTSAFHDLR